MDLGFSASLILGAIAAVAILYFFPPAVEEITISADGEAPETTTEYDLVKIVALSLIVGSAGPAFLSTAQSRIMAALNAQQAQTAVDTGINQVDQMVESAKAAVPAAVQEAVAANIPNADPGEIQAAADAAADSLETRLKPQAQVAREQMKAVTLPAT